MPDGDTTLFPLRLSQDHLRDLIGRVRDWQYQHGSLLKFPPRLGQDLARPIGATVFPSNFPRGCYEEACQMQPIYNKLYASIAEDEAWLHQVLESLIESPDSMARILWEIYSAVKADGLIQPVSLGIFRSDYMLCEVNKEDCEIKQVEFNTYSVAGGAHGNKICDMHKYLHQTGMYGHDPTLSESPSPQNHVISSIAGALQLGHHEYRGSSSRTAVLMVVQPNNVNICDERPIEKTLWQAGIPAYRVEFGDDVLASTTLTESRDLLFHPVSSSRNPPVEISVIYHRAGYDVDEYTEAGLECRYRLERSRAIKAPSLLCHMATLKIVQQKLCMPGILERFLTADESSRIRRSFVPMYPLDESDLGLQGRAIALDPESAARHVLKPSLEGGGHNIYRDDIPAFLSTISPERWQDYILMETIPSPLVCNILLTPDGPYSGPVISELGVFGACLWRKREGGKVEMLDSREIGTSLKTKKVGVDEMSVVKGYGCFDSPYLI